LNYFLGIEVKKVKDGGILLTQMKYAADILAKAGMSKCKKVGTLLPMSEQYSAYKGTSLDIKEATRYSRYRWSITISYTNQGRYIFFGK
jgi:hypothetical protein